MAGFVLKVPENVGPPPVKPPFPECAHRRAEERIQVRGKRAYRVAVRQCLQCGRSLGSFKCDKARRDRMPLFDHKFRKAKAVERSEAYDAVRAEHRQQWWDWYSAYLRSPRWLEIRGKVLARDGGKCRVEHCRRTATQVHHLTYERVGSESLEDLVSVCDPCHQLIHGGE